MASVTDILGTDILHTGDFQATAAGDFAIISGRDNLLQAIYRRIFTVKGSVIHRPSYGVGVGNYLNRINSISSRTRLINDIKEQLTLDPRIVSVDEVSVAVDQNIQGKITIKVTVTALGLGQVTTPEMIFEE